VRFWDSSALVTLHVEQAASVQTLSMFQRDPQVAAWTFSDVEMRAAIARLERESGITPAVALEAVSRIETFWKTVHAVTVIDSVKSRAKRLLGVHPLHAADALQLGAALALTYDEPRGLEFVCLDLRLGEAARREGFAVVP